MVRLSSENSHHQLQDKNESLTQSTKINSNTNDSLLSSSNILHVVRQALLNAAEELVAQEQIEEENKQMSRKPLTNKLPLVQNRNLNKSYSSNRNTRKKKKPLKKNKTNRRK